MLGYVRCKIEWSFYGQLGHTQCILKAADTMSAFFLMSSHTLFCNSLSTSAVHRERWRLLTVNALYKLGLPTQLLTHVASKSNVLNRTGAAPVSRDRLDRGSKCTCFGLL